MLLLMRAVKLLQWARMLLGSEAAAKMSTDEYEAIWNNVLYVGGFSMSSEKVMAVCKGPMPETDKESIELEAVVDYALSMSKEDLVKKFEEWCVSSDNVTGLTCDRKTSHYFGKIAGAFRMGTR